jgi:hypothetical protein
VGIAQRFSDLYPKTDPQQTGLTFKEALPELYFGLYDDLLLLFCGTTLSFC